MNGVHDMGGMQGYGPVLPEKDESLFHEDWERRALALTLAMGATGQWNIDLSRAARESLPPAEYLGSSYYAIWLRGLEKLMRERALVVADELASGVMSTPPAPVARVLQAADVDAALARGSSTTRPPPAPAEFALGMRVRARNMHPQGHTRLPQYVRGHTGTIVRVHGAHVFADAHASRPLPPFLEQPEWLYTVVFTAQELWGPKADAAVQVSVDAWEPYLEPAA
jgi:nitrile hydratase beta subunit